MFTSHKQRIIAVFVGALLLLAAIVVLRPSSASGLPKPLFWRTKVAGEGKHRLVAAGDSRTLRGIAPQEFANFDLGPGLNFGFQGAALNSQFLDAAVSKTNDKQPAILLLGITPNAFTQSAERSNGFDKAVSDVSPVDSRLPNWYFRIIQQLEPSSLLEIKRIVTWKSNELEETYHSDGWLETVHNAPNEKYALRFYRDRFNKNMASPELLDRFLSHIATLAANKICVFAFRPPITEAMADIEDTTSGFNYTDFVKSFEASGGTWLETDSHDYETYDGSHLLNRSAIRLSQTLAAKIADHLDRHEEVR